MKIWRGYGSEHSMNLVLIGHFKSAVDADDAKALIDRLAAQVDKETGGHEIGSDQLNRRFSEAMLDILNDVNLYSLSAQELEQLCYDVSITLDGTKIIATTDEIDVSALIKIFLDQGARVEVYSAHEYHDTGYGRNTKE